jgi:hypothetical protein
MAQSKEFNGQRYRLMQYFPTKAMAQAYARGLRKGGRAFAEPVKARVTKETKGYCVWARGRG